MKALILVIFCLAGIGCEKTSGTVRIDTGKGERAYKARDIHYHSNGTVWFTDEETGKRIRASGTMIIE